MTTATACAYLGDLSAESFARLVAAQIPQLRWPGEPPRFDRKDIDRWVDSGAPATSQRSDAEWLGKLDT